jgi:hypothetical protein
VWITACLGISGSLAAPENRPCFIYSDQELSSHCHQEHVIHAGHLEERSRLLIGIF